MSVEKVFGVYPRTVIPPALVSNVAQNIFLPGALNLRFGMAREEALKTCPGLEYDGAFKLKYFLGITHLIILEKELKGIEFEGGFPKPSRETVNITVEWLLGVFGAPNTAFEEKTKDGGRFGLIWKRDDCVVPCWFSSTESGKSFYAHLQLLPKTTNLERVLSSRGGRELPKTPQAILASLKIWSQTVAQLESKPNSPLLGTSATGRPDATIDSLEKYEVLSGEGLSGSAFVIRYRNRLYGVCSMHQFEGKVPKSLEPITGASVQLEKIGVIRQKDVQVIPLKFPQQQIQYLTYNSDFAFQPGEELFVLGPSGGVELGMLTTTQIEGGGYRSANGPKDFVVRMAKPFTAAGGSGCPVIQKSTGRVVGVLLSADDPRKARVIEFETLCLPK